MVAARRRGIVYAAAILCAVLIFSTVAAIVLGPELAPASPNAGATISGSAQSFTDETLSSSGGTTTVATFMNDTVITTMESNQTTQTASQCPVIAANGPDDVPNAPAGQITQVFGSGADNPVNVTTIAADTLVWNTWMLSNSTLVCGGQTQFLQDNYTSHSMFAFYVDGRLVDEVNTTVPAGQGNQTDWSVYMSTPLYINQTLPTNSTVALAILSSVPVVVFVASPGQTYESPCTVLPTELPSSSTSADFTVGMFGFSTEP